MIRKLSGCSRSLNLKFSSGCNAHSGSWPSQLRPSASLYFSFLAPVPGLGLRAIKPPSSVIPQAGPLALSWLPSNLYLISSGRLFPIGRPIRMNSTDGTTELCAAMSVVVPMLAYYRSRSVSVMSRARSLTSCPFILPRIPIGVAVALGRVGSRCFAFDKAFSSLCSDFFNRAVSHNEFFLSLGYSWTSLTLVQRD